MGCHCISPLQGSASHFTPTGVDVPSPTRERGDPGNNKSTPPRRGRRTGRGWKPSTAAIPNRPRHRQQRNRTTWRKRKSGRGVTAARWCACVRGIAEAGTATPPGCQNGFYRKDSNAPERGQVLRHLSGWNAMSTRAWCVMQRTCLVGVRCEAGR